MTPVLLGVVLSWFFTETFGWVFAGLVVPGYLASVFLLHPMGGVIDVIEAILTYGLARLLGEHVARTGLTSRIFGRERFFLIVVCSILVRVLVEGMLLPALLPRTPWAFSIG
ncbi:MAG TPA: poly-gamma-glutamate biosynthesis protein PgsC/CapC, partial [Labilithrix sp.]|nr:poly-gamma-glutamate biosynthesis protein PgsC/CapC [Labilithrix sp.]